MNQNARYFLGFIFRLRFKVISRFIVKLVGVDIVNLVCLKLKLYTTALAMSERFVILDKSIEVYILEQDNTDQI